MSLLPSATRPLIALAITGLLASTALTSLAISTHPIEEASAITLSTTRVGTEAPVMWTQLWQRPTSDNQWLTPDGTPALASNPGGAVTVFLDLDGYTVSPGNQWHELWEYPEMDVAIPGVVGARSARPVSEIFDVWVQVSEDFAPWDVNVTTIEPTGSDITRTDATDPRFGITVVVAAGQAQAGHLWCGECLGTAVRDAVSFPPQVWDSYDIHAFVWDLPTLSPSMLADAISHEAGHAFGLQHPGLANTDVYDREATSDSDKGFYTPTEYWNPLMNSVHKDMPFTIWTNTTTPEHAGHRDPLAQLDAYLPRRVDDAPNQESGIATPVKVGESFAGVISSDIDTDAFTFTIEPGTLRAGIAVETLPYPNINIGVSVYAHESDTWLVKEISKPLTFAHNRLVSGGENNQGNIHLVMTTPQPGTYTVIVHPQEIIPGDIYGSLGNYRITIKTQTLPVAAALK